MPREPKSSAPTVGDDELTVSTSTEDASTTAGAAAVDPTPEEAPEQVAPPVNAPTETTAPAGDTASDPSSPEPAGAGVPDPTRIIIEQAAPAPDVLYSGEGDALNPNKAHVKADYQPFQW